MLVKELIAGARWIPGLNQQSGHQPKISFLMPSYCRQNFDLFVQAVTSVLDQSMQDIELIIVDDCSPNETARAFVENLVKTDPRVSCIQHAKNIGLPAISEWEAFLAAKGEYLAFAFDDFVFSKNGIEELYLQAKKNNWQFAFGYVRVAHPTGNGKFHFETLGGRFQDEFDINSMMQENNMPNGGVLLHRNLVNRIGFYDPNIVLARVCDWDLWRRAAKACEITRCDIWIGDEHGPSIANSLLFTYHLDFLFTHEYMNHERNHLLTPDVFGDYDIQRTNSTSGADILHSNTGASAFIQKHGIAPKTIEGDQKSLVVMYANDVSSQSVLDWIPKEFQNKFTFFGPQDRLAYVIPYVMRASALLVCHHSGLTRLAATGLADFLRTYQIPVYVLVDESDRLLLSVDKYPCDIAGFISADPLIVDKKVQLWPISADLNLRSKIVKSEGQNVLKIGVLGSQFSGETLENLRSLTRSANLTLFVEKTKEADIFFKEDVRLDRVVLVEQSDNFRQLVYRWQNLGLDLLITPQTMGPLGLQGIPQKHIFAYLTGTLPLIENTGPTWDAPFSISLLTEERLGAWLASMRKHDDRAALLDAFNSSVERHYSSTELENFLVSFFAPLSALDDGARHYRWSHLTETILRQGDLAHGSFIDQLKKSVQNRLPVLMAAVLVKIAMNLGLVRFARGLLTPSLKTVRIKIRQAKNVLSGHS